MSNLVREFEATQQKQEKFDFRPGDTIRVHVRIVEGGKERIQDFEGVCIRRRGGGMNETFTVRRISYGVGMERVFPLNSPRVASIDVVRRGKVRRANLNYLRKLKGKKARISEDLVRTLKYARESREQKEQEARLAAKAQETPAEAAGDQATEETPVEETAVEETPVEAAEDQATEEAPVEEAKAEETSQPAETAESEEEAEKTD